MRELKKTNMLFSFPVIHRMLLPTIFYNLKKKAENSMLSYYSKKVCSYSEVGERA